MKSEKFSISMDLSPHQLHIFRAYFEILIEVVEMERSASKKLNHFTRERLSKKDRVFFPQRAYQSSQSSRIKDSEAR